jgi:hypothetical protein
MVAVIALNVKDSRDVKGPSTLLCDPSRHHGILSSEVGFGIASVSIQEGR